MDYSGAQIELRHGEYSATVTELGARLRSLTYRQRPLVASFGAHEVPPLYRGAVLAPWPNRIADGRYEFGGETHQLPINEPERMTAVHGLVVWNAWTVLDTADDAARLGYRIWPRPGYPFAIDLVVEYTLGPDGLTIALEATNSGDRTAPYGCSIHPYLVAGAGVVDEWSLQLPASELMEADSVRLLPTRLTSVKNGPLDFAAPTRLGVRRIDNAFTGLQFDAERHCSARVIGSDGHGVAMTWDDDCPWVQVHTADRPEPEYNRVGLALEPMTCPPNAFRSGTDIVALEPGDSKRVRWTIGAV